MSIKVAVVDDCELIVAGVRGLLGPYPHRAHVVELDGWTPRRHQVDVLLYDPSFPCSTTSPEHRESSEHGRLAALGWEVDPGRVRAVIRTGADGYIGKALSADDFVDAIERVHRGELVVPADPAGPAGAVVSKDWLGEAAGFSARESQVMALICEGVSNREIAERIYVSINTVKTYIRSAYRKVDVQTRAQAVIWGLSNGFDPPSPHASVRHGAHP